MTSTAPRCSGASEFAAPAAPRSASLLLTGRCNLSCPHCTVSSSGPLGGDIDSAAWLGILDTLASRHVLHLTLSGGEPFAREDFPEIAAGARARPFRMGVNTNATLVGRAEASLLAGLRPRLSRVMVSLDGDGPLLHDRIRGGGAFDAMLSGVEALRGAGIVPGFCCTVTSINASRLEEIVRLALDKGAWVILNPFVRSGPCLPGELELDRDLLRDSARLAFDLSRSTGGRVRGPLVEMEEAARAAKAGTAPARRGPGHSCGGLVNSMTILPDGSVAPCDHMTSLRVGSLISGTLDQALSSEGARRFRARVEAPLEECGECLGCGYLPVCPGGCPVIPWAVEGPLGPDPLSCLRRYLDD